MFLLLSVLFQLDTAVVNRQDYVAAREKRIADNTLFYRIASPENQYTYAQELWEEYNGFDNDSAICYAQHAISIARANRNRTAEQRSTICLAQSMAVSGNYQKAFALLRSVESRLDPALLASYCRTMSLVYIWQAEFTTFEEDRAEARRHILPLRQKIIETETDPIWLTQERALVTMETSPKEALSILLPVWAQLPDNSDYVRYLANSIGSCYRHLYWQTGEQSMQDSALYYFALSAISDMQHGVMEHASLREVALILFQRGDIERAYRYMNCCIADAQHSKARLRTIEMANDMPLILNTYHEKIDEQQHRQKGLIYSLTAAVSVLVVLLCIFVIIMRKWHRTNAQLAIRNTQLAETNRQLSVVNTKLNDSNRIRDTYVTRYMTECSDIIEQMNQYHKGLLRMVLSDQPKPLMRSIRQDDPTDHALRDFYQHFDETFLSLFPRFVEDFNTLLRPEERFAIPQQNRLSTELRIFALIRLGITNSDDIARFLRLSTKTVYNYRTQTRNRAVNRDQLETQVKELSF